MSILKLAVILSSFAISGCGLLDSLHRPEKKQRTVDINMPPAPPTSNFIHHHGKRP